MEEYTVKEDFHRYEGTVISCKMRLQVEVGKGTTRGNGKREERKCRDEDIKKRSEQGSSCPTKLTSWLPGIRDRPYSSTVLSLTTASDKINPI